MGQWNWEKWQQKVFGRLSTPDEDSCWLWFGTSYKRKNGKETRVGRFSVRAPKAKKTSLTWAAHRIAYILLAKKSIDNETLDHVCHNSLCCNYKHLQEVSDAENNRRKKYPYQFGFALDL